MKSFDWLKFLLRADCDFISRTKLRYPQFLKPAECKFRLAREYVRYDLGMKILDSLMFGRVKSDQFSK